LENVLGEEKSISGLIESLKKLLKIAREEGLELGNDARVLSNNLDNQNITLLESSIENLNNLSDEKTVRSVIRISSIAEQRNAIENIIIGGEAVINAINDALNINMRRLKDEVGPGLTKSENKISSSLVKISGILTTISQL